MPQYWNHLTGFDYNLKPLFYLLFFFFLENCYIRLECYFLLVQTVISNTVILSGKKKKDVLAKSG